MMTPFVIYKKGCQECETLQSLNYKPFFSVAKYLNGYKNVMWILKQFNPLSHITLPKMLQILHTSVALGDLALKYLGF